MSQHGDHDELFAASIEELRRFPAVDPAARDRLRAALSRERRTRGAIVLSPLRAAAAAVVLVAATSMAWLMGSVGEAGTAGGTGAGGSDAGLTPVQFVLAAPDAGSVALAGDFNGWNPAASPLRQGEGGVWSIVVPLARGAFSYSFVIDGAEWRADPRAAFSTDDFGRPSSVLFVTPET